MAAVVINGTDDSVKTASAEVAGKDVTAEATAAKAAAAAAIATAAAAKVATEEANAKIEQLKEELSEVKSNLNELIQAIDKMTSDQRPAFIQPVQRQPMPMQRTGQRQPMPMQRQPMPMQRQPMPMQRTGQRQPMQRTGQPVQRQPMQRGSRGSYDPRGSYDQRGSRGSYDQCGPYEPPYMHDTEGVTWQEPLDQIEGELLPYIEKGDLTLTNAGKITKQMGYALKDIATDMGFGCPLDVLQHIFPSLTSKKIEVSTKAGGIHTEVLLGFS